MASPKVPSKYVNPEYDEEAVQKRAAAKYAKEQNTLPSRRCRHCATFLQTMAEWRLGIHVRCVYEIGQQVQIASIPRPRYGRGN